MKTVTTEFSNGKWAVKVNGEWLRTPKTKACRWFKTEAEALRAVARGA